MHPILMQVLYCCSMFHSDFHHNRAVLNIPVYMPAITTIYTSVCLTKLEALFTPVFYRLADAMSMANDANAARKAALPQMSWNDGILNLQCGNTHVHPTSNLQHLGLLPSLLTQTKNNINVQNRWMSRCTRKEESRADDDIKILTGTVVERPLKQMQHRYEQSGKQHRPGWTRRQTWRRHLFFISCINMHLGFSCLPVPFTHYS